VQADYSGIEGAVAAWGADEHWKVQALHEIIADPKLPDMYRRTAASI
jgi:DNA polymerase